MQKFKKVKSIPAYLPIVNIDTDMIIPKQFLKTIKRTGLGKSLFFELRYDENNKPIKNFILNQDPYDKSEILLADKNFGCGSSREHAAWSLLDFGIEDFRKHCLIEGLDDIALTLEKSKKINDFLINQKSKMPWLF